MTNSEKVVGGRFGQGGRLRQVPLAPFPWTKKHVPAF